MDSGVGGGGQKYEVNEFNDFNGIWRGPEADKKMNLTNLMNLLNPPGLPPWSKISKKRKVARVFFIFLLPVKILLMIFGVSFGVTALFGL